MKHLVQFIDNEPRVSTLDLADLLGVQNRALVKLLQRYKLEFEEFGLLAFKMLVKKQKGKPKTYVFLNEDQAYFLLVLSRNTENAVTLKQRLIKEFTRLRKRQVRQANLEWQKARADGKIARHVETDTIQAFVDYATQQGSRNAQRYYCNLTKMTYKALGLVEQGLKIPNQLRDLLDGMQLSFLTTAEYVCASAISEGMARHLFYKDIYQLARERVENYARTVKGLSLQRLAS